jgi:protein gp37
VSAEPLLEPITLTSYLKCESCLDSQICWCVDLKINWVIVGGESGPDARLCDIAWIRSIVRQCKDADVPVFVKQLGSQPHDLSDGSDRPNAGTLLDLRSRKGGDPSEWPEDLRVREMPQKQGD